MSMVPAKNTEDARNWKSPTLEDACRKPDPNNIMRILKRATATFEKPLGTAMVLERRTPFELLVSTICSAQARDSQTAPIVRKLFTITNTPEAFARMPLAKLQQLLYPVSYYNTKAKHLIAMATMLIEQFDGQVPRTMSELLQLPGVGRKTANLVLNEVFGLIEGICVDTHVHRISNRLGIIRSRSRTETEALLMRVLPKRLWAIWNPLLVMWGQNICVAVAPKCSACPVRKYCQRRGVTTSR